MNGFYHDYDNVVIETPEERQSKIKKQRKLFSRIFLAISAYIFALYFSHIGIYAILSRVLSPEAYENFASSLVWSIIISSAAQYLISFPIFLLMMIGTDKAEAKEKKKLAVTDFLLFFLIGEALMYVGNLIGNMLNEIIGEFTGQIPDNSLEIIIAKTPMWLIFIVIVIIGPIVEELIFRKLMIDRLSIYGDRMAIIFSAVAFGLMHGNLYQLFYATLLGALLGYVYTYTRDIKYTIFMHMIINFIGSVVTIPVQKYAVEFYEALEMLQLGFPVNILPMIVSGTVTFIYSNIQYGFIVGGIIALVHYIRKRKINISPDKEIYLSDKEIAKGGIINVGAILFLSLSILTIIFDLIF
jgi:membrane protease YdiL (CAAX protease family)